MLPDSRKKSPCRRRARTVGSEKALLGIRPDVDRRHRREIGEVEHGDGARRVREVVEVESGVRDVELVVRDAHPLGSDAHRGGVHDRGGSGIDLVHEIPEERGHERARAHELHRPGIGPGRQGDRRGHALRLEVEQRQVIRAGVDDGRAGLALEQLDAVRQRTDREEAEIDVPRVEIDPGDLSVVGAGDVRRPRRRDGECVVGPENQRQRGAHSPSNPRRHGRSPRASTRRRNGRFDDGRAPGTAGRVRTNLDRRHLPHPRRRSTVEVGPVSWLAGHPTSAPSGGSVAIAEVVSAHSGGAAPVSHRIPVTRVVRFRRAPDDAAHAFHSERSHSKHAVESAPVKGRIW